MLDAARSALQKGDKAAARAQLDAYAARFPKGQLAAEAQAMRQIAAE
jgi:TolA-binding protein